MHKTSLQKNYLSVCITEKVIEKVDFSKRGKEGGIYITSGYVEIDGCFVLLLTASLYTNVDDRSLIYKYKYYLSENKEYYNLNRCYNQEISNITGARLKTKVMFKNCSTTRDEVVNMFLNLQEYQDIEDKILASNQITFLYKISLPVSSFSDYDIFSFIAIPFVKSKATEQIFLHLVTKLFDKQQLNNIDRIIEELWKEEVKFSIRDVSRRFLNSCLYLYMILALLDRLGDTVLLFVNVYTPTDRKDKRLDILDNELKDKGISVLKEIIEKYHKHNK